MTGKWEIEKGTLKNCTLEKKSRYKLENQKLGNVKYTNWHLKMEHENSKKTKKQSQK